VNQSTVPAWRVLRPSSAPCVALCSYLRVAQTLQVVILVRQLHYLSVIAIAKSTRVLDQHRRVLATVSAFSPLREMSLIALDAVSLPSAVDTGRTLWMNEELASLAC
jgi:hypothetical protein